MAMYTFLENYDWTGKTVIPFATHAGSGLSNTVGSIKNICTEADVLNGFSIKGETAQNDAETTQNEVTEWLKELNLE